MDAFDVPITGRSHFLLSKCSLSFINIMIIQTSARSSARIVELTSDNDISYFLFITGSDIIKALENGVSQFPKLEGRFPQVAGMTFGFDASKPPGQRIEPGLVKVQGEHIIPDKVSTLKIENTR